MRIGIAIAAFAAASALPQAASAADLPARPILKAPAPSPAMNWSGFYVTGGGGHGLWAADTTTALTPGSPTPPMFLVERQGGKGWLGRVGGGFDYQFSPRIIAGVMADFDFSSIEGTIVDPAPAIAGQIKQTWSWAAGGRVGWLMTPQLLSYFNAGYTSAHFSSAKMFDGGGGFIAPPGAFTGDSTPAFTANGWFLGGGTEIALSGVGSGWFWRNEYRYGYYGNHLLTVTGTNPLLPISNSINFKPTVQTVTTQIVFKFNPGISSAVDGELPAAGPASWSGLYVNAGGGYGLWAADTSATTSPIKQTQGGKGWLGRAGGGFDYQFMPMIVAGVFADFDASSLKGTIQDMGGRVGGDIKQTYSWAAGARAGLLATPNILSYVSAGYTSTHFTSVNLLFAIPPAIAGTSSGVGTPAFTADGWFLGSGVETTLPILGRGWFWRNEYRYAQYQAQTLPETVLTTGAVVSHMSFKPTVQTITTQLVYKFN
jgi:outer membrane immunogenic protein